MPIKSQPHVSVKCTENIALLYLLHPVPAQPSSNPVTNIQSKGVGYSLPFNDERRLVNTLAFLAHIEDNPDHIPAVCLQETPQNGGLNVLLAVNRKGLSMKWKKYATDIKMGFDKIAAALRHVDDRSRDMEREVFALIIELCKKRILCRLRFAKKTRDNKRGKKRMTIADGLQRVVDYLRKNQSQTRKLFLERAQKVLKLADAWEKHQTYPELSALVDGVNSLRQVEDYQEILGSIPNRELDASMRSHLLNMTCKVARYRESARLLCQAARQFPQVRQVKTVIVDLPDKVFSRPAISNDYHPTVHSTVSRIQGSDISLKGVRRICNLLQVPVEKADARYNDQVKDALKNSKVHAEIQLLYYCHTMLQGKSLLPRVICSSKSACWLCNAFILFHGKIHMPRSHGRLYPGWCLPNLQNAWSNDIATRFNQHLEKLAAQSLQTLYQRKTRTNYPDPLESELSTITWLSLPPHPENGEGLNGAEGEKVSQTNAALLPDISMSSEVVAGGGRDNAIVEEALDEETSGEEVLEEEVLREEAGEEELPVKDELHESSAHSDNLAFRSTASAVSVVPSTRTNVSTSLANMAEESQEQTGSYNVARGEVSPVYSSGPLKLQFEYAGSRQQQVSGDEASKQLSCTAGWLSFEDSEQLKRQGVTAVDIESLTGEEISCSIDMAGNIYLEHEGTMLRLTLRPA
ncbi:hypothetical protein F5Y07DRAFT_380740 [Xylaria sp. FL0933]|nr:hypothetical protein F5Y07DRAFT_380740 [Xylaria sp. FL0933]